MYKNYLASLLRFSFFMRFRCHFQRIWPFFFHRRDDRFIVTLNRRYFIKFLIYFLIFVLTLGIYWFKISKEPQELAKITVGNWPLMGCKLEQLRQLKEKMHVKTYDKVVRNLMKQHTPSSMYGYLKKYSLKKLLLGLRDKHD